MNTYLRRYLSVLFLFFVLFSCVHTSVSMSLDEAVELAMLNEAQHKADIHGAEARRADGWQAVAGYGPSLSVSASVMDSRDAGQYGGNPDNRERAANYGKSEVVVSFSQPLVDLEKVSVALQGRQEMTIAKLLVKKADEDLVLRVHERYYAVLSRQESLRLAEAESAALLQQMNQVTEKLDLGFGTITDQHDANARYRLSRALEISQRSAYENAVKALEEVVAYPVMGIEDLDHDAPLPLLPHDKKEWIRVARSMNSDLQLQKCRHENARLGLRAVESRFLPRLSAFADYVFTDADGGLLDYGAERSEFDLGFRLDMDFFSGGADAAAASAASRREQEARQLVRASERSLERSVASLCDSIHDTELLIESYRLAVDAHSSALEASKLAYDEGVKPFLDVLDAQQKYYRALRLYKTSRYEYMILQQKFRNVLGVDSIDYQHSGRGASL